MLLPFFHKLSKKEYLNTEDTEKYNIGLIYAKKNATNFFKLCYYIFISCFGYYILKDLDYLPTTLGGSGVFSNMFKDGFDKSFFFAKHEYFNYYYLGALAFHITDLIWLLGIYELQSDFLMMLVHHFCTISLIVFSFLSNHSNYGSIVIFLHDIGDIFVYIARILLYIRVPEFLKVGSGILLLLVWIYTRLYVFADVITGTWTGINLNANWVNLNLVYFLCFLYILHCYWVFLIFKKVCAGIFAKKYEDTFKVKKIEEKSK